MVAGCSRPTVPRKILSHLKVISVHFFRNLFLHAAHSVGLLKHIPAAVTFQYPEILRPLATRFRGRHRLTVRDEGTPRCVGCMLCETVCPAKCITIVAGEHPDQRREVPGPLRHRPRGLRLLRILRRGFCPEDAIRMDTGIVDVAAYSRGAMQLDIHELMNPKLRKPITEANCTLKFPHECRLSGGHVKGDWKQVYGETQSEPGSSAPIAR
jgi:NADH-quinone oxidoreductase subunit I